MLASSEKIEVFFVLYFNFFWKYLVNTLLHSPARFTSRSSILEFDNKIGAVDNLVSYEQASGEFTSEVKVVKTLSLVNPKTGGIVRTKTRYVINSSDIDTLVTPNYQEITIP